MLELMLKSVIAIIIYGLLALVYFIQIWINIIIFLAVPIFIISFFALTARYIIPNVLKLAGRFYCRIRGKSYSLPDKPKAKLFIQCFYFVIFTAPIMYLYAKNVMIPFWPPDISGISIMSAPS